MTLRLASIAVLPLVAAAPLAGAPARTAEHHAVVLHGRLRLKSSKRCAIVSGRRLRPGSGRTGAVTIANTGRLDGKLTLRTRLHGSRTLARALRLIVQERRRGRKKRVVYSGRLAALQRVRLGTIRAGHRRRFVFTVSLRSSAPNGLQGLRTSADFVWTAAEIVERRPKTRAALQK